jgi:hypothetical protein
LAPLLAKGQGTITQVLVKNGATVLDVTRPEYPELHAHPLGTLTPFEFGGHRTAAM